MQPFAVAAVGAAEVVAHSAPVRVAILGEDAISVRSVLTFWHSVALVAAVLVAAIDAAGYAVCCVAITPNPTPITYKAVGKQHVGLAGLVKPVANRAMLASRPSQTGFVTNFRNKLVELV